MLIVEEVFLLLTKDNGTADRAWGYRRHGLVAAALVDLAQLGVIDIAEGRDPKVSVVKAGVTGHASLDVILPALDGMSGKKVSRLVASSKLNPATAVGHSLAEQGIVTEESRMFGGPKFVTVNPAPEIAVRERLGQVLAGTREPTIADAAELGILKALNVAYGLLGPARGDLDRRGLSRRIESVSRDVPSVEALKRMVDSITASTVTVAVAAGSSSS
ncbi:GPP34 family phosphoprotein [Citricoccus sp. GCM10030269]|uniref:GOLPH3/VPS74 family protein n=1 Tax=Citricoccus sp. GCM10030269 TaxID=3273388 RepID=UPI00361F5E90